MRIEDEIKLTFDDVLIRPKRSTLVSRSEVQLERTLKFKHTSSTWTGIPIVSANMDTTGTFETAISLQKFKMITAIHKFYSIDDWKNNIDISNQENVNNVLENLGIDKKNYLEKIQKIEIKEELKKLTNIAFEKNIFGAPTFVVNKKIFWGNIEKPLGFLKYPLGYSRKI